MRSLTILIAGIAVGGAVIAVPATAHAVPAPISLDDAQAAMISDAEAQSLGVPRRNMHEFTYAHGTSQFDGIWLCDLQSEDKEIEIAGAHHYYGTEFLSESRPEKQADQEIQAYSTAKKAAKVNAQVRKGAKECRGTFTHKSGPYTVTIKLSNGRGTTADGKPYTWVLSQTLTSDAKTQWADHDYVVVQRSGRFIQMLGLDSEGKDAPPLTAKQRARTDALGPELLARWTAAVG